MKRAFGLVAIALFPLTAWAAPPEPPPPSAPAATATATADSPAFGLTLRLGMGLPQVFSQLRNFGVYELEFGYMLPVWERRLQISGAFEYSQPPSSARPTDLRVLSYDNGYKWELSQREYVLELNLLIRAFPPTSFIVPYAKVGFRIYLLDTLMNGNAAGQAFGEYTEKFTEPGFVLGGGLDVRLGPGAFNAEVRVDFSDMNRRISGDSNTGMLAVLVGYRFFF